MALEDILKALEDKAQSRIEALQSEAQQHVAEITSEVERDALRIRRARLKKVEDAVRSESTAIVYSASLKAKNDLIKAQEETVDEAFQLARERLSEMSSDPSYPEVLEALLDEVLDFFEGEVVLSVRPQDRDLAEKMMSKRQRAFRFDDAPLDASGGLIGSSPSGEVVVFNTFETRLEKARDKLRLSISKALFGQAAEN